MCGRYGFTEPSKFNEYYNLINEMYETQPNYNVAPSQSMPVVVKGEQGNQAEIMKWGLIPSWSKDAKFASINARAESVATKSSFAKPLRFRRCVIPANYFFEWKRTDEGKVPFLIKLKDEEFMSFAGIYDENEIVEGKPIKTYAIITTDPNEMMDDIHNRMPVILSKEDLEWWLNPDITEPEELLPLLDPFPADLMEAYPVSSLVNKPANNFPEITKPLP